MWHVTAGWESWSPSHPCCLVSPCPSARELELEDRQSRLQQELRERMAVEGKRRASGWEGEVGHCPRPHA